MRDGDTPNLHAMHEPKMTTVSLGDVLRDNASVVIPTSPDAALGLYQARQRDLRRRRRPA